MSDIFSIPVEYKGKELSFEAELQKVGYIHKVQVNVNGVTVIFEPDEERNYRAVLDQESYNNCSIDVGLVKAIGEVLGEVNS